MRCWIKATGGQPREFAGARIGIDYYSLEARICGPCSEASAISGDGLGFASEEDANYVKWGTDWTLKEWDWIVPEYAISDGGWGGGDNSTPPKGTLCVVAAFIPWLQIWGDGRENGAGYFAEFELYINP